MAAYRRIRVRGIRKEEIDTDKLALAYWLMAKRAVEEKRDREAAEKKSQRARKTNGHARKPEVSDAGR